MVEQSQEKFSLMESVKTIWAKVLSPQTFFPLMVIFLSVGVMLIFRFLPLAELLQAMELKTFDLRMAMTQHKPSEDIVILAFDEDTFKINTKNYGAWPYSRDVFADCIETLDAVGAKIIVFDLMFIAQQKGDEIPDQKLVDAFKKYKNVIISMNFDNNFESSKALGIPITPDDISRLKLYSVDLLSKIDKNSLSLDLDSDGFFQNEYMSFNSFRKIMQPLYETGERVGFINHAPDVDGMTRFNPLFFRFQYQTPVQTLHPPIRQNPEGTGWIDDNKQAVDHRGYMLDDANQYLLDTVSEYYPYLAFRAFLHSRFIQGHSDSGKEPVIILQPDGSLKFADYNVPLYKNGNYIIKWYNANVLHDRLTAEIEKLNIRRTEIISADKLGETRKRLELKQLDTRLASLQKELDKPKTTAPYKVISAWRLMQASRHLKEGTTTNQDQQILDMFKGKYVFAGNTSPGGFDIKSTPVGSLPGVTVQATVFDNLYQNRGYMTHVPSHLQVLIVLLLCTLVVFVTLRSRSILAMLGFPIALSLAYTGTAIALFLFSGLWLNIVIPLILVFIIAAVIFATKYLQRTQAYQDAYAAANTDSMTGLYNYRFFKTHMANCIENCDRFNTKFSLVLIDIDHFKKFNDTYGHQAGDEVLRCVAKKLKDTVRTADIVCRYGGEEMAVIVEKTPEEEALLVGKKVVSAIASEEYPISEGVTKPVTISAGVATYPTHGKTIEELIEFSDKGLYRAKENGRNQVGAQFD